MGHIDHTLLPLLQRYVTGGLRASYYIVSVNPKHSIRVYPCPSVAQKTKLRKLTERQRKQAIWPRMDTDTHGCGVPASSRSTGRRLEQNCMVMFWRNAILVSLDLVHQVAQRLSFGKARYVVDHQLVIPGAHAIGQGGDVRRDDHVLEF